MLDKLTKEQIDKLLVYRDRWLSIGLKTGPVDRTKAIEAMKAAYKAAGLPEPKIFIWLASPYSGAIGAQILCSMKAQVGDQVGAQVWDQVWAQVGAQVRAQVGRCGYGLHDSNWLGFYNFF